MLMAIPGLTIDNLLIIFTMIDRQGDALFTVSVSLCACHLRSAAIDASVRATTGLPPTAPPAPALPCAALPCRHDPDSKWARYWRSLPDNYYTGAQQGVLSSRMLHALRSHMHAACCVSGFAEPKALPPAACCDACLPCLLPRPAGLSFPEQLVAELKGTAAHLELQRAQVGRG